MLICGQEMPMEISMRFLACRAKNIGALRTLLVQRLRVGSAILSTFGIRYLESDALILLYDFN